MKIMLKRITGVVLTIAMLISLLCLPVYANNTAPYIKNVVINKENHTINVSCKFSSGEENRLATVILATEEIDEAIDMSSGKIQNIMVTPIEYSGEMEQTIGYDASICNYILYVLCGSDKLKQTINLSEHLVEFNISDKYGALTSTTMKGRLEERLAELPDEVAVTSSVEVNNSLMLYVATNGSDDNSGTIEAPFKTIDKALEKLAESKKAGTIILRGGEYPINKTVSIDDSHNLEAENKGVTVIKGYPGEAVTFTANPSLALNAFTPLTEELKEDVIDQTAKEEILQISLPETGFNYARPNELKLYINGSEVSQSRWPNNYEVRMGDVVSDKEDGWTTEFISLNRDRLDKWDFVNRRIYFNGCFNNADYAPAVTLIREYDKETGKITTGSSWAGGANSDGENATHFYQNVFEEIDVPGEWCVDDVDKKLYIYPTDNFESAEVILGTSGAGGLEQMFKVTGAQRILFDNINFAYGKEAVFVSESEEVVFQNCGFENFTSRGVVFEHSKYCGMLYSALNNIGKIAAEFTYKDGSETMIADSLQDEAFANLIPSRNFMYNCIVNGVRGADNTAAIVCRSEIGDVFSHNVIGNVNNNGFLLSASMELIIEYNEIFSFAQDISDSGGVYLGNLCSRGNLIRYNYIHDGLKGGVGVYFDNMSAGNYAYGNIIKNCLNAYSTNGGRDNAFGNNIVINDNEKFDKDVCAIYSNPWQYHPAGTTYFENNIVPQAIQVINSPLFTSSAITQRYTEWMTQLNQIAAYVNERDEAGSAYTWDYNDKTDIHSLAKGISGNYMGNNMIVGTDNHMEEFLTHTNVDANGVNHGKYCWMWGIDGFCDENGTTEGINTNVTYNNGENAGFADYVNDNFALNSNADMFVKNTEFEAVPFEDMGLKNKTTVINAPEFYGTNYTRVSDGDDIANISWSGVNGAEEYFITIAEDAEFTKKIVDKDLVRDELYVYEGDLYAHTYYIKVECSTSAKSYGVKKNQIVSKFEPQIPKIEIIDKTEGENGIDFKLKNNTGEKIEVDVFVVQNKEGYLNKIDMYISEELDKDSMKPMNVKPVGDNKIEIMLWDKMMSPYTEKIKLK